MYVVEANMALGNCNKRAALSSVNIKYNLRRKWNILHQILPACSAISEIKLEPRKIVVATKLTKNAIKTIFLLFIKFEPATIKQIPKKKLYHLAINLKQFILFPKRHIPKFRGAFTLKIVAPIFWHLKSIYWNWVARN